MRLRFREVVVSLLLGGAAVISGGFAVSPAIAGSQTGVNDFTFSSMHATYLLGMDATGHSTLTTIEKLTAVFPASDQNHGIQRSIPLNYDGHSTNLTLESVVDGDGATLPYSAQESGAFLVVTIANSEFLHGSHTFILTYTQRDVTFTPTDGGGNQEFYWDVNGIGWAQPFDSVVAVVMMPGWIANSLTGNAACYQGIVGATTKCSALVQVQLGTTAKFTATANALAPGENLTVAIGFTPRTFIARDTGFFASPLAIPLVLLVILAFCVLLATLIIRRTRWKDHAGRGIIIAQYGPPLGVTPLVASTVFGVRRMAVSAAIIGLAVRGNIRILDEDSGTTHSFTLELVSGANIQQEEIELLQALFGNELTVGSQRILADVDTDVSRKMTKVQARVTGFARTAGFRGSIGKVLPAVLVGVSVLVAVTGIPLAVAMARGEFGGSTPILLVILMIVFSSVTLVFSVNVHPLTKKGAALRDHLRGLREFISLAEADRLRVLQSPGGILRERIDAADSRIRLKLSEKVLPYAVLFGLEKEWSKELANLYVESQTQPTWFVGGPTFNMVVFSSSLGAFATAAQSSWAASASRSGLAGSGGGGFSGGGGGGGGGGGV